MPARHWAVGATLLAVLGAASPAHRQDAVERAHALAERADTAGALAVLDSAVRAQPRNAAAWYLRGMILWENARPSVRQGFATSQENIRRLMKADTSIRRAAALAPDSGRYALAMGRWLNFGSFVWLRAGAGDYFDKALAGARRAGDRALEAEALDEQAMIRWRRYEAVADRRGLRIGVLVPDGPVVSRGPRSVGEQLRDNTFALEPRPGELDYTQAVNLLLSAAEADPRNGRVSRHLLMALAERRAWEELRRGANARIAVGGDDAIAWMARGLAGLRLNELGAARVAFDSGLARMTPAERARFTDTRRLVPPADSVRVSALAPATRAEADRRLWALADPLALTPENEHWLEFLGRVTFAELRWTSDDLYLRGADSDRGDVHVRYGPPDLVASFPAEGLETNRIIWFYELGRDDLTFIFEAPPTYGTARFAAEPDLVADAKNMRPAGWTNVPITRGMDTVAMQVARFRAAGDSSDVLITAALPIRRMSTGIDLARGTLGIGLSLLTSDVRTVLRDTTRQLVPLARDDSSHRRVWQLRLAPAAFTYRVEALQEESMRAARAVGPVTVEATRGFGMSDVLLAERVAPRDSARVDRWSDLLIVPSDLAFRSGQPFDIVWETYDLGAAAGQSRYRVDISLRVLQYVRAVNSDTSDVAGAIATATSSFLLRTIDRANVLVKRLTGAEDVALSFTRERRAGPVALDYLTMELGEARGGRYRLTVRTTDLQTNRTTSRERDFLVVER